MGKAEYVPITTLSRHLKTHQPCASGASLCKQAGAGTKLLLALCLRRTQELGRVLVLAWPGIRKQFESWVLSRTQGKCRPDSSRLAGASR